MRRRGRIFVSDKLIIDALHMPRTASIIGASVNLANGGVELLVEHDELPDLAKGALIPRYAPIITQSAEGFAWDWNTGNPYL